jgi:hypothetical protein
MEVERKAEYPVAAARESMDAWGETSWTKARWGAMGLEERAQTSEISHVIGVEGEEGEERPLGLAIISMSHHRHLG